MDSDSREHAVVDLARVGLSGDGDPLVEAHELAHPPVALLHLGVVPLEQLQERRLHTYTYIHHTHPTPQQPHHHHESHHEHRGPAVRQRHACVGELVVPTCVPVVPLSPRSGISSMARSSSFRSSRKSCMTTTQPDSLSQTISMHDNTAGQSGRSTMTDATQYYGVPPMSLSYYYPCH